MVSGHTFPLARENSLSFIYFFKFWLVCWQFQLEAPAPSMGYMGGNNRTQGTHHLGVPQVPRSLSSPPTLIFQTLLMLVPRFLSCKRKNLNALRIFPLGWNQKIDLLPEGRITLKNPPSSRNLSETVMTPSNVNSFLCLIPHCGLLLRSCSQEHSTVIYLQLNLHVRVCF